MTINTQTWREREREGGSTPRTHGGTGSHSSKRIMKDTGRKEGRMEGWSATARQDMRCMGGIELLILYSSWIREVK